jgi:ComF family protein
VSGLRGLITNITNFVLPHRCASCSELTEQGDGLCAACFSKLNFISAPYCKTCGFPFEFEIEDQFECGKCIVESPKYDLARSLFKFDYNSKKLIHGFKYNDQTSSAKLFSRLLISRYKDDFHDADIVAPVPMNRFKRIFRNYNPPQILGKQIAESLGIMEVPDLLLKTKWTKPQTKLTKALRQKNLHGSLEINTKYNINGKIILLVDDVRTTGTTSNICSAILKKAGAKSVKLLTIGTT